MVRNTVKVDNLDVRLLSVENKALWHAISPHSSSVNLFQKKFVKDHGDSSSRLLERRV